MEDVLESDSGLFSKDQTLAALRHAKNRQYLCMYSWHVLISSILLSVHRLKKSGKENMDARLTIEGRNHHRCLCAPAGIHVTNCLLIQKAIMTCLFVYIPISLQGNCGGLCVLTNYFFIAKILPLATIWENTASSFFCPSLKQYEHSLKQWVVPSSKYGQVSSCWSVGVCVCVWILRVNIHGMVLSFRNNCDDLILSLCWAVMM